MKQLPIYCLMSLLFLSAIHTSLGQQESILISNGDFELVEKDAITGWNSLWTRDQDAGKLVSDDKTYHNGARSARIEHKGDNDWSFASSKRIKVQPGDIFSIKSWIKMEGSGSATISVVTYDGKGKPMDWSLGDGTLHGDHDWQFVQSKFIVPDNTAEIWPRIIGYGPATVWADDYSIAKEGNIIELRPKDLPGEFTVSSKSISISLKVSTAALTVTHSGRMEQQRSMNSGIIIQNVKTGHSLDISAYDVRNCIPVKICIEPDQSKPEFTMSISAEGKMNYPLRFPQPFVTADNTYLVVPMNEGISYPVTDDSIAPLSLIAYGGHGICMGFWGATDGDSGHMAIIETPDDAVIRIDRIEKKLCIMPEWNSQKGNFGYTRKLRYVFFEHGGHVAICKRYRSYAQSIGLLKTLKQKQKEIPAVDLLIGAVNIWTWEKDSLSLVSEMKSLGIEQILWSNRGSREDIRKMNEMGNILTSRYDIFQDLMDPEIVREKIGWTHSDWTQSGWPDDLILDRNGVWEKGWRVKAKDGIMYPCGVLCDKCAPAYARERVSSELKTHPYQCRFIDTTTASPWRECYNEKHPMTRTESRETKMELLNIISSEMKLVTGSETGHDAAVPYVHYFEGMLSLGPYRVDDSGRNMIEVVNNPPERLEKFQLGHKYRLPLWELVYHDCVVAQWYWGDYNNKIPKLWDKRDLFNILYGTPPMFMFNKEIWGRNKERFAQSYKNICPLVRRVGYEEMTDHRFLASDRSVQQSSFSDGTVVTVNFGENEYILESGEKVGPMTSLVKKK